MNRIFLPRYFANLFFAFLLPTRFFSFKIFIFKLSGVCVGVGVRITSECKIFGNGTISLGDNTWLGVGAEFHVPIPGIISIGCNCDIAPRVRFLCGSHEIGDTSRRAGGGIIENIVIGSGVWIGAGATLLPGAILEDGIVVAAGSVVTKGRYPTNSLLAGNPAKVKKIYEK